MYPLPRTQAAFASILIPGLPEPYRKSEQKSVVSSFLLTHREQAPRAKPQKNTMKNLKEVYEHHAEGLKKLFTELEAKGLYDGCSYPLLMSTWADNPTPKAMFFGQETNGWGTGDSIETLMQDYLRFNLGENYPSLFWQYLWKMSDKLGLEGPHPFLWNNVNKFGKVDSKGRPESAVTDHEVKYFNVLKDELGAVNPEMCVFFTGPYYDEDIKAKLPDVEFLSVEGYSVRELAQVKSAHLPEKSYRTYHPMYGNRHYDWYQEVLDKIASLCK